MTTSISFQNLEIGKKYKITYPWIPNYSLIGTLKAIRPLKDCKQYVFQSDKKLKPVQDKNSIFNTGDILVYDQPLKGRNHGFELI